MFGNDVVVVLAHAGDAAPVSHRPSGTPWHTYANRTGSTPSAHENGVHNSHTAYPTVDAHASRTAYNAYTPCSSPGHTSHTGPSATLLPAPCSETHSTDAVCVVAQTASNTPGTRPGGRCGRCCAGCVAHARHACTAQHRREHVSGFPPFWHGDEKTAPHSRHSHLIGRGGGRSPWGVAVDDGHRGAASRPPSATCRPRCRRHCQFAASPIAEAPATLDEGSLATRWSCSRRPRGLRIPSDRSSCTAALCPPPRNSILPDMCLLYEFYRTIRTKRTTSDWGHSRTRHQAAGGAARMSLPCPTHPSRARR